MFALAYPLLGPSRHVRAYCTSEYGYQSARGQLIKKKIISSVVFVRADIFGLTRKVRPCGPASPLSLAESRQNVPLGFVLFSFTVFKEKSECTYFFKEKSECT